MSATSKINKSFGKASRYFCNKAIENSRRNMYLEEKKPKQVETVEITRAEKVFKNQKIEVFFEGDKEDLSDLRLKVFVNNSMKFVSQEGAFVMVNTSLPRIVREGWFFTTIYIDKSYLQFKEQQEYERFQKFTIELRDCVRVNDMFRQECVKYAEQLEEVFESVELSKPLYKKERKVVDC
ncbi:MAG: hypothetical protein ACRDDY_17065 [Clostridium sp.]|uniref:hypothetical protein n=1 Tax=Clostridium sp. TaxID=1506 RepID=UPI003EE5ADF2